MFTDNFHPFVRRVNNYTFMVTQITDKIKFDY